MTAADTAALLQEAARCYAARDYGAAARHGRAILQRDPRHFDALHLLGVLCLNDGQPAEAMGYLRRAERERPDVAQLHYHLGNALLALKLFVEADSAFARALALQPNHPDAWNNRGNALAGAERHQAALDCFQRALALRSHTPVTLYNLARSLAALGRHDDAANAFRAALAHAADVPADRLADIWAGLCNVYVDQQRYHEALAACREVPAALRDHPLIAWNESLTRLMLGDYAEGWRLYERRFDMADHDPPRPGAAALDLSAVAGRRVLVFGEQGRGDAIQFARYLPLLAERGAEVIAEVYPDLQPLFATLPGVATVIVSDHAAPAHDLLTPLLSLPHAFATTLATIPAATPYLAAPADRLERWGARLGEWRRLRVGLSWWGAQHIPKRSFPAQLLAPLLATDAEFHAVQKEITPSDADWLARHPAIRVHATELRDFADTAALLRHMDLVISIDTSVAHLAGALGRPVWILLPFSPDWRWLADRDDSPWYPTARLFRQARLDEWDPVMRQVATALAQHRSNEESQA